MKKNVLVSISIVFVSLLLGMVAYFMNAGQNLGFPSPLSPRQTENTIQSAQQEKPETTDTILTTQKPNPDDLNASTEDIENFTEDINDIEGILTDPSVDQLDSNLGEF